jgi:hypothetical protein
MYLSGNLAGLLERRQCYRVDTNAVAGCKAVDLSPAGHRPFGNAQHTGSLGDGQRIAVARRLANKVANFGPM